MVKSLSILATPTFDGRSTDAGRPRALYLSTLLLIPVALPIISPSILG